MSWNANRGVAVGLFGCAVVSGVAPFLLLASMGWTVGRVPAAVRDGMSSAAGTRLLVALAVTGALVVVTMVIGTVLDAFAAAAKDRLTHAVRVRLMRAVSGPAGITHLEDPRTLDRIAFAQGSLSNAAIGDVPGALARMLSNRLSGLLACGFVAWFRWWLGLGLLCVWVLNRVPLRRRATEIARALGGQASVLRRAMYFQQLASRPAAAKEVRVFGLADWAVSEFRREFVNGWRRVWQLQSQQLVNMLTIGAGMLAVYGIAYGVVAHAALHNQVGLATATALLPMLGMTTQVGLMDQTDDTLNFALASLPDLEGLEADLSSRDAAPDAAASPIPVLRKTVRFEGVRFTYPGSAKPVFEGLDLELEAGRSTAIVGVNGAGKTTIVKLLARLHEPDAGRLVVDGVDLASCDSRAWQRQVAIVFQDFTRYPLSVADNVGFGKVENRDDSVALEAAADRAGARDVVESLERGWDTVLSRSFSGGADLSGGQWQRLALARALFAVHHGVQILVLDEPTAWLDAKGEAEFFDRFLDITRGLTTVVISHRFSTVRRADHIVVLDGGRVVEEGTHESLVAERGRYAEAFRLQASRFGDAAASKSENGAPDA
jgi:ATP-binding cassette subfamily B protein